MRRHSASSGRAPYRADTRAYAYSTLPARPRRSVLFLFVTAEERGLLGSDYFARHPTVPREGIVADLTLDMPFLYHPLLDIVPYGAQHSTLSTPVTRAAARLGIEIATDPIPEQVLFIRSDHFSFVRQGVPSLFIKSGFKTGDPSKAGSAINAGYRRDVYHKPNDDMSQPFDFEAGAAHVKLNFLTGWQDAFDERKISFTVLTGSSQILLLKKIRESLAGHAFFYELWPLMQCELSSSSKSNEPTPPMLEQFFSSESVSDVLSKVPETLLEEEDYRYRKAENHILKWGGMPALLDLSEEERWLWLKNYGYTYLERDLSDLARMDHLMPFRKFQRLSALRSGMLLNYSEIARDAGISVDTARRYLEYLRISYQAILLQPYYRNLTISIVKTPKLFWADVGIWRQLTGYKGEFTGQLYETMVVGEITKWLRTSQCEAEMYFYGTRSGIGG